jgi:hypothetical protein
LGAAALPGSELVIFLLRSRRSGNNRLDIVLGTDSSGEPKKALLLRNAVYEQPQGFERKPAGRFVQDST